MNAIMNKTNNGKLLAAIAVFAMLACVFAVAMPAVSAADNEDTATTGVNVSVDGDTEWLYGLTNDKIGNYLTVSEIEENNYLITGIAMYVGDASKVESPEAGSVMEGFKKGGAPAGYPYGIIYSISDIGGWLNYTDSAGNWQSKDRESTTSEMLKYINESTGSSTYYITDDEVTEEEFKDLKADEYRTLTVSWDLTLVDNRLGTDMDVTLPAGMGMTSSTSGTTYTINLNGTAIAAASDDDCEDSDFVGVFTDAADGYAFVQLNGLESFFSETVTDITITQKNSALGVYSAEHEDNISNATGSWVKTKSYVSTDVDDGYAFLVPKDGSQVTIELTTGEGDDVKTIAKFVINTNGLVNATKVDSASEVNSAFTNSNTTVILDSISGNVSGTITIPDEVKQNQLVVNTVTDATFTISIGDSVVTFTNFSAKNMTVSIGSTAIVAEEMKGDIEADDVELSGSALGNINLTKNKADSDGLAYVPANTTLDLKGTTLTVESGVIFTANGSITNGTIVVEQGATLQYSNISNVSLQGAGTFKVIGGQGTENIISVSQSVNGTYYLTADTTILEGVVFTVPRNAVLDLQGYDLIIEGTLVVDRNGTVTSSVTVTDSTGAKIPNYIELKSTGAIQNNGTIGKDGLITVKNGETPSVAGDQTVSMQEINGVNIQLVRSLNAAGDRVYDMYVSGNVSKISGAVKPTLSIVNVGINADMSIGKDVTFNVDNAVVAKNVTLTNGGKAMTITNDLELSNGAKVVINVPTTGTIVVPTGTIESGDEFVKGTEGQSSVGFTTGTTGDVVGLTVSAGRVTIPNDDGTADIVQRMYIGGSMGVAEKDTEAGITLSNDVYITESLFVPEEVEITGTYNIIVDQAGTVTAEVQENLTFTGAEYIIETTSEGVPVETYYYTSFANAMAQIAAAQGNIVYVSGTFEISGTYTVAADQYIEPKGTHAVTVAEDGAITVDADGVIENDTFVKIYGKVTALEGTGYTPAKGAKIYAVYTVDEETNDTTYSGFKLALDGATSGQTITVVDEAEYDGNMTIASGVTVDVDAGVTLTVLGNVTVDGKLVLDNLSTLKVGKDAGKDYTITVNGELDASEGGKIAVNNGNVDLYSTGTTTVYKAEDVTVDVNAAYYIDGETVYTSVAKAVAYAEENALPNVYAKGTFTESSAIESDGVNINILGTVTLGTVTINNAKIQIGTGADADACYTADVSGLTGTGDATATVSVSKTKATVESIVRLDAAGQNGYTLSINSIDCAVEIAAGTVQVTDTDINLSKTVTLTIASGATMLVNEDTDTNLSGSEYIKNSGTIQIDGEVTIDGYTLVSGDIIVSKDGSLTSGNAVFAVTGNVTVDPEGTFRVNNALQVGASPELLGVATTGSIDGEIILGSGAYVIVFDGASVADATITDDASNELNTTAFTINGTPYASIYATSEVGMDKTVLTSRIIDMKDLAVIWDDNGTDDPKDDTPVITWYSGEDPVAGDTPIGEYATLNTEIRYNAVGVTISIGSHITLSIDNVVVDSYNGYSYPLTIGTHQISAVVDPGFSGDVTIVFNGQPVTNGQIEITSEMLGQLDAIVLSATGQLTQDSTVVIDGGSSGDSSMGLTDYLLIILVILIVVMAIIVALRLMRS